MQWKDAQSDKARAVSLQIPDPANYVYYYYYCIANAKYVNTTKNIEQTYEKGKLLTPHYWLNVSIEWLALQLRIREVPSLILAHGSDILTEIRCNISEFLQENVGRVC